MSKYRIHPADPEGLTFYSLRSRPSKVRVDMFARPAPASQVFTEFVNGLPDILAGRDMKMFLQKMRNARAAGKPLVFGCGAHVIKVGLSPVFIDMMEHGWITALALNGAGIIHDLEIALVGQTSEDVDSRIGDGRFGMAEETGRLLHRAIRDGAEANIGLGEAVGRMISSSDFPHRDKSLLAVAYDRNLPVTVHVAVGTDFIHFHPDVDGRDIGQTTLRDFFLFCALVEGMDGGVFCNVGSSVILPEVFLKSVTFARNKGKKLENLTTAVFDFNRHYRPDQNVVRRPPGTGGEGFYFIGHHELMIPLLSASLKAGDIT
ncbi:MAG: hypothetical protein KJ908_05775 [Acidobacteria bacterium]|nr:hypothetical protein [Acidobacteriota bacterium]MCG2816987.1 hypothetical protein [Candidatus Aminicenantes bacterium]